MSEKAEELARKAAIAASDAGASFGAGAWPAGYGSEKWLEAATRAISRALDLPALVAAREDAESRQQGLIQYEERLQKAEARESALRADLERERAAAALVLETSAREVARLERVNADLLAKLNTSWQASDIYAEEGEEARRERDALKAAAQRHLTTHGCDFVDANGRTCRDCDELRAALATPAEPPAEKGGTEPPWYMHCPWCKRIFRAVINDPKGYEFCPLCYGSYSYAAPELVGAPATEPTEGGGE